jgi:pimeloyl-ACP methyl ester carboxylesterase
MDQIKAGGHRIAYERKGEGPPLILLHGFVGDSREWRRQIDELSDEFMVVAWDAPGCGRSSDPPATFRFPDYADCLAAFVDALGLGRPHVAGLSFGGALALELYRRHPTIPMSLVLACARIGLCGVARPLSGRDCRATPAASAARSRLTARPVGALDDSDSLLGIGAG